MVYRALCLLLVVGCVGDSTTSGGDAGADASVDVNAVDVAQGDVTIVDSGVDAGKCPPPSVSPAAGCSGQSVECVNQVQVGCKTPGGCQYIGGYRQILCGSTSDCDAGVACCVPSAAMAVTSACPNQVSLNNDITNFATECSTATKGCATSDLQVCLTTAECVTGTCQGAVFVVNGASVGQLGICQ